MSNKKSVSTEKNVKKAVETKMYWWLNKQRQFYIGDEYRIDLVKINSSHNSVKIVVTNLKTCQDESPSLKESGEESKIDWSAMTDWPSFR